MNEKKIEKKKEKKIYLLGGYTSRRRRGMDS
jgi:hypothetical protein